MYNELYNKDLKIIKKYYGEKMMHLCRKNFSTILETQNLLPKLLLCNFEPSKNLYKDLKEHNKINNFIEYIDSMLQIPQEKLDTNQTPQELLDQAGYKLYDCNTNEDINKFKKYYAEGEELCTFNDNRLKRCHVFFAVKKNVNEIVRQNFQHPQRQDEYGTSVISIQFYKGTINNVSIKNRYNHKVVNPDATFSNNLDNIIPGLTNSFRKYYNLYIRDKNVDFELPSYVQANDGKYYKYSYEINDIYYCPNNVIIDKGKVKNKYSETERYLIIDYFVLDLKEKTIKLYDNNIKDSFIDSISDISKIEVIKQENQSKKIIITNKNNNQIEIEINDENQIISYNNKYIKTIENRFLYYNKTLQRIYIEKVAEIQNDFLCLNTDLEIMYSPNVEKIKDCCLYTNKRLTELYMDNVKEIGHFFLPINYEIKYIYFPNLEKTGSGFMHRCWGLEVFKAPKLKLIGTCFLQFCKNLREFDLPNLDNCYKELLRHTNRSIYCKMIINQWENQNKEEPQKTKCIKL